jgi:HK97 family phage prohead protease
MKKRNITFKNLEIRGSENAEGKKFVDGLIPYESKSVPIWGTTEVIARTAFNKTLADKNEVRAMYNHDDSKVLGSTKSGTLVLSNTDEGLVCRCELPNTSYANDLFEVIDRGDVRTMSFGFIPVKWEDTNNGKTRTLREVELLEISFGVAFPAYPETSSNTFVRKINMDPERLNELLEKEELSESEVQELKAVVDTINVVIEQNTTKEEETEAAKEEEQREDGTPEEGTSVTETEEKEEIKKEIIEMIDDLFELEQDAELGEEEETEL